MNTIISLNDDEILSREAIAEYVEDLHNRGIINAEEAPMASVAPLASAAKQEAGLMVLID